MSEEKNLEFEKFLESMKQMSEDEDFEDDIVTLQSDSGEDIDFIKVAGIAYRGDFYEILQPVELLEGMEEDEALVFKVSKDADGEEKYEIETDETILDAVFAEYERFLTKPKTSPVTTNSRALVSII